MTLKHGCLPRINTVAVRGIAPLYREDERQGDDCRDGELLKNKQPICSTFPWSERELHRPEKPGEFTLRVHGSGYGTGVDNALGPPRSNVETTGMGSGPEKLCSGGPGATGEPDIRSALKRNGPTWRSLS